MQLASSIVHVDTIDFKYTLENRQTPLPEQLAGQVFDKGAATSRRLDADVPLRHSLLEFPEAQYSW